jgi:hypothetical protein
MLSRIRDCGRCINARKKKKKKFVGDFQDMKGWSGIIPYSVKYKSTVESYNIFPSHTADDVFYCQQSSVHV